MATKTLELSIGTGRPIPGSNFPEYRVIEGTNFPIAQLLFDAATDEAMYWQAIIPDYGSGNISILLDWYAQNATTGNCVWEAQISAHSPTDNQDLETDALATLNFVQTAHQGTTSKRPHRSTITLSNLDSIAGDDRFFLRIARDANGTNATDDMSNDASLYGLALQYSDT